jgi:hypothetical protein
MPDSLPDYLSEHLKRLGEEIDIGRQPTVFDGGLVGKSDTTESEVMKDVAREKAGSQSGPRPGQRTRPRPRAQAPGHHFRSEAVEAAHGAEFRKLARHYEASGFEDKNGLWVVAKSRPLGSHGPQVHFLTGFPLDAQVAPRAWAFEAIGREAKLASLKHTNFPDASICAYVEEDFAWPNSDGFVGLIDIFSIWMIKKWHRELVGWWPGKQYGACALYRRLEFDGREQCGCMSGLRYRECHLEADRLVSEPAARAQFKHLFKCNYEDRRPPTDVMDAARRRWARMPQMASVFAHRFRDNEPILLF